MQSFFNSPIIETIICLVLCYALLSLLVSSLTELLNSYFQERGRMLYRTIAGMFADGANLNFGQLLYGHPAVQKLRRNIDRMPQYISNAMFASVIIDVIAEQSRHFAFDANRQAIMMQPEQQGLFDRFVQTVHSMKHTPLKSQLLNMVERCVAPAAGQPDLRVQQLNQQLESWYSDQMERTSGWYKQSIQWRLFFVGLAVALMLNVDSIYLFQSFYRTPTLRQQLMPVAEAAADQYEALKADTTITAWQRSYQVADSLKAKIMAYPSDSATRVLEKVVQQLEKIDSLSRQSDSLRKQTMKRIREDADLINSLGLPIGWYHDVPPLSWKQSKQWTRSEDYFEKHRRLTATNVLSYLLGILITALSLQFGAPFWFEVLIKLVNIRRAGTKPDEKK